MTITRDLWGTLRASPIFVFYITATLVVSAIIGLITVNVIDLGMAHFGEVSHRTHDVAYGALFSILVLGVLVQLARPHRNVAAVVMAQLPFAALLLTAVLVGDLDRVVRFNPLRNAAAVAAVAALLHPAGPSFFRSFRLERASGPLAALVAVAAVPLIRFGATNLQLQRTVTDMHSAMGHYAFMAALSYTIIAVGLLAALRPVGWRLCAWVAGLSSATLGAVALLYPDASSSLDTRGAAAAIAWAVAFLAAAARTEDPETAGQPRSQLLATHGE